MIKDDQNNDIRLFWIHVKPEYSELALRATSNTVQYLN